MSNVQCPVFSVQCPVHRQLAGRSILGGHFYASPPPLQTHPPPHAVDAARRVCQPSWIIKRWDQSGKRSRWPTEFSKGLLPSSQSVIQKLGSNCCEGFGRVFPRSDRRLAAALASKLPQTSSSPTYHCTHHLPTTPPLRERKCRRALSQPCASSERVAG